MDDNKPLPMSGVGESMALMMRIRMSAPLEAVKYGVVDAINRQMRERRQRITEYTRNLADSFGACE